MRNRIGRLGFAVAIGASLLVGQAGNAMAAAPTSAPTILSPGDGASVGNSNPTLSWAAVANAVRYRVQISTTNLFSSTIYSQDTYALQATPPALLPFSTLYWRVAGEDGGGALGPYSVASFTKSAGAAPTPLTPTNGQTLTFPTSPVIFSWLPVPGATSYTVQIDDASDFIGATQFTTANTSYTLTDTQSFTLSDGVTPKAWWWQVQARYANATVTQWSPAWSYQIVWPATPNLQSPLDDAGGVVDSVFSWNPVPGAAWYQIQVSPNGDFANNSVIDQSNIVSTRFAPATTLNNSAYYWRVRARAGGTATNYGQWSTIFMFTRSWSPRPVTISPHWAGGLADPPIVSTLEFSWTPASSSGSGWVDHASQYVFQISTSSTFSGASQSCTTNQTTLTPYDACPLSIVPGTVYYWRVRGNDQPLPVVGLWDSSSTADTQRFIYEPDLPDLSCGPANGSDVQTPVLCWSAVSGAQQYQVTIKKGDGTTVEQVTTYGLTFTPLITLDPGAGPYTWNVVTVDHSGHLGLARAPATWPSFNIVAPVTDTTLGLLTPADGASAVRMPSMTWVPYTGASYYEVLYGPTSDIVSMTPLSGATHLPYAGFTYASIPLVSQRWYWIVEAFNASNVVIGTSLQRSFYVGTEASLGDWIIPWSDYLTPECQVQTDPAISRCTPLLGQTQEMTWAPAPDAGAYVVTVAKDVDFTNIYKTYETSETSLTPLESWLDSQAGQAYYWFVRPCIDWSKSVCGPGPDTNAGLDNASAYRKASPAPVDIYTTTAGNPPVAASTVPDQVTFNWPDYITTSQASPYPVTGVNSTRVTQEARQYKITVSTALDFGSTLDTATVDQTQYTPWTITYPEGPLYWRVQAVDGSGNLLTLSSNGTVTKASAPISLTSPAAAGTVSGVPYFTWSPQNWAARYTIEVYRNGDLNFALSNRVFSVTTAIAAWSPTATMAAGTYAWRVQRLDQSGRPGPWSAGRTFTLQPAAPTLNSPSDLATLNGSNLYFTWLGVQGAVSYQFQSSTSASFSPLKENQTTVMTAWSPVILYAPGTYYWRVNLLDASNNVLSTSASRSFVVPTGVVYAPTTYHAVTPTRLLDTRNGTGGIVGPLASHLAKTFQVTGAVVPVNATAVTGNLTVTGQTSNGYLFIGPVATNNPTSSTLNFPLGDDRANGVTVALSGTGSLSVTFVAPTNGPTAQAIFDVTGYFTPDATGATYHALSPTRLLDTRDGTGGLSGPFANHVARTFQVTGGVVPAGATAVTGNLTVTGQTSKGYLFIGPVATNDPTSSTLNFPFGDDRANAVTVALSGSGTLSITFVGPANGTSAQAIFDVTGYFTADLTGARYVPLNPTRILDTRDGTGGLSGPFTNHAARTFQVSGGSSGVPSNAAAVTGNLTVTGQTSGGYLFIGPVATNYPTSSTLNFPLGDDRANGVTVALSGSGTLSITFVAPSNGPTAQAIFDVTGYFVP